MMTSMVPYHLTGRNVFSSPRAMYFLGALGGIVVKFAEEIG